MSTETEMHYGEALAWIRELEAFIRENGLEIPTWEDREKHKAPPHKWSDKDFELKYDATHTYPFFEDDNGTIFAYGHWPKKEFAEKVNEYDSYVAGLEPEDCHCTESDVKHLYAIPHPRIEDNFTWMRDKDSPVLPSDEGAFPLTMISR